MSDEDLLWSNDPSLQFTDQSEIVYNKKRWALMSYKKSGGFNQGSWATGWFRFTKNAKGGFVDQRPWTAGVFKSKLSGDRLIVVSTHLPHAPDLPGDKAGDA